jgi:hypothetical protein
VISQVNLAFIKTNVRVSVKAAVLPEHHGFVLVVRDKPDLHTHLYRRSRRSLLMFGSIKKIFGGILAFITGLFGSKKKAAPELAASTADVKPTDAKPADPKPVAAKAAPEKSVKAAKPEKAKKVASSKSFYLDETEARGFEAPNGKPAAEAKPAKTKAKKTKEAADPKPVAAAATTPVAPAAKPSTPAASAPANTFKQFATRRPGANMSSFLDMAKQVKTK